MAQHASADSTGKARVLRADDILQLRFIRDGRLSPSGRWVAYEISSTAGAGAERFEIHLLDLESGAQREVSGERGGRFPRWSPESHRLAYVEPRGEGSVLTIVDLTNHQRGEIAINEATIQGPPAWSPNGQTIAVVLSRRMSIDSAVRRVTSRDFRADRVGFVEGISQCLVLIDVASGALYTLVDELGFYTQLQWDDVGERILLLGTRNPIPGAGYSPTLYIVHLADRRLQEPLGEGWFIGLAKWVPGGKQIVLVGAYRSTLTIPTTDLWMVDLENGAASLRSLDVAGRVGFRLHHDMPIWDTSSLNGLVAKDERRAWVNVQRGGQAEIWQLSLTGDVRSDCIAGGERACLLLDATAQGEEVLFLSTDLMSPPDLYLLDGKTERRLTHVNQAVLADWPQLSVQSLRSRSPDGLELEGWFLTKEHSQGPLPTVLFVHGGPFLATGHAFRFDFHLLASRGIGVLFANFRGSFGYGESFARAIMGDWGTKGFPDHMAVVDQALELGVANRDRLGVWGASHGGFATAWVVGHTARFRAAVAEASITDLTTAYYLSDAPELFSRDLGGKPHEIPDVYRSRSPLTYAHRVTTPTLLIHGEKDFRCPISQAEQFHRALLDASCISEMVRLRDADHMGDSMGPPSARVGQNAALIDWFERFL